MPGKRPAPVPGALLIFCDGVPACVPMRLEKGELVLGRERLAALGLEDESVSRKHARIAFDARGWTVCDLGSRNGTFVDTRPVRAQTTFAAPAILRLGRSLFLLAGDIGRFERSKVSLRDGLAVGPTLGDSLERVASIARQSSTIHIAGESGTGKEVAARVFHAATGRGDRPFVAVNCAAIPEGVAERILFGAVRGAYSGAIAAAQGYVEAADGGTLFLDEVADLDLQVQGKLLRVVESQEFMPLGASEPRRVDVRICCATNRDLREEVAAGRFREDLFYRLDSPQVRIPPLRERLEELPWLIGLALQSTPGLTAHGSLVEACAPRPWPGNVRELVREIRGAAVRAAVDERTTVHARDLGPNAGAPMEPAAANQPTRERGEAQRRAIEDALRAEKGNVTAAARALGMHRTQLRRWLARHQVDPRVFSDDQGE